MTRSKYQTLVLIFEFILMVCIGLIPSIKTLPLILVLLPIIGIIGIKIYEYKESVQEKHLRVKIQLKILSSLLQDPLLLQNPIKEFRCAYQVPSGKNRLLQVFDYIPEGGGGGRKLPINKGIVGLSFKMKCEEIENFYSDDEYRRQMVDKYHFTQKDLQKIQDDRRSYFAFPLIDEFYHVLGIIYFDSATTDTFNDEKNPLAMRLIRSVCTNIKQTIL